MKKQVLLVLSVTYKTLPGIHNALNKLLKWDCGQPKGTQEVAITDGQPPSTTPRTLSEPRLLR